jgi:hypothetical protein
MYNTKYICTYNNNDVISENDDIDENQKQFIKDVVYRQDLLNIFDMVDFNDDIINDSINNLYIQLESNEKFNDLMLLSASKILSTDLKIGLMMLFSFDLMFLSHKCISEFIDTGEINHEYIQKLQSIL